jgi:methanethiol oxidase
MPKIHYAIFISTLVLLSIVSSSADETSLSPYMPKIRDQEAWLYVWTAGMEGVGDGQDKLVVIAANPDAKAYGRVINTIAVGSDNEAHQMGFTDDRRYLWASGLVSSRIFIFDTHTQPDKPSLHKTLDFTAQNNGLTAPSSFYAVTGGMLVTALANNKGRNGLVEYNRAGDYIATHLTGFNDSLGYDIRAIPRRNVMFTSSFTNQSQYLDPLKTVLAKKDALQGFGSSVLQWNLRMRQPKQAFEIPGTPLAIRCALASNHNYCFTATLFTNKLWLLYADKQGLWQAEPVADIGTINQPVLPVNLSIQHDDKLLWVSSFMDGKLRAFDISDPFAPSQVFEQVLGQQVNHIASSWEGKRLYVASSWLAQWDKAAASHFVKAYAWDGKALKEQFAIDFTKEKLGRPKQILLGGNTVDNSTMPLSVEPTKLRHSQLRKLVRKRHKKLAAYR